MIQLLSYPLDENTPLYGDTPRVQFSQLNSIQKGSSSNSTLVSFCTHSGTHIDVPLHFCSEGKSLTDYSIDEFIFNSPFVLNCPRHDATLVSWTDALPYESDLEDCDLILIKTGYSRFRDKEIYRTHNPGISPDFAEAIMTRFPKIRAVGIDTISVSSYQNREAGRRTHRIFLDNSQGHSPLILIEDLNLQNLSTTKKVFVIPLLLKGLDGSPATVFAEV